MMAIFLTGCFEPSDDRPSRQITIKGWNDSSELVVFSLRLGSHVTYFTHGAGVESGQQTERSETFLVPEDLWLSVVVADEGGARIEGNRTIDVAKCLATSDDHMVLGWRVTSDLLGQKHLAFVDEC